MAWKHCGRRAMTWITGVGFRIGHLYCVHPYQLCELTDNNRHKPYRTALWRKSRRSVFVAFDPISNRRSKSSTDSEVLQKWGRFGGGLDSQSTLTLVVSLGWNAGQKQERMDGIAWHVSIQKFLAGYVGRKKKETVYWLHTLSVSMKCNHNPSWAYLLHIQATHWSCGSLLFINIYSAKYMV